MSMPKAVRHINEIRALDALLKTGPMSRADLARELSVTRSTASSIVSSLVGAGFLTEEEPERTGDKNARTGRPGILINLRPEHAIFIGADIAVGRITIVALNLNREPVTSRVIVTKHGRDVEPAAVVDELSAGIRAVLGELPSVQAVRGIAVAVPGLIDRYGNVVRAPLLGWKDVALNELLAASLENIEVSKFDNDANAFAFAHLHSPSLDGPREAVYLLMDAGVGGCVVSDGNILRGASGYAGEIGHMTVGEEGFASITNVRGSLESFVGRQAVLERFRQLGGVETDLAGFIAAVDRGDEPAKSTLLDWAKYLGRACATITSLLNPERIVLGGAVAALLSRARSELLESMRENLLQGSHEALVEVSTMGPEAPATGAALMLHREFFELDPQLVYGATRTSYVL